MCRWLAYSGPALRLSDLLFKPENSLIRQSLAAHRSIVPTNGDGFGLGWYGTQTYPGLFKDTLPAWNDENLLSLSQQIESPLFFAHVRASSGTPTSRENCHPFRWNHVLFMHNGHIGGYAELRRSLEELMPNDTFSARRGTTDSEAFFLLACGNGLEQDVETALKKTVAQVLDAMAKTGTKEPFRMTAAITGGDQFYALRFSSDKKSPSLFYGTGGAIDVEDGRVDFSPGSDAVLVLSEPLDECAEDWEEMPEAHLLKTSGGSVEICPFHP